MKELVISGGNVVLLDDDMHELLSKHRWYLSKGRVVREKQKDSKREKIFMHRLIAGAGPGETVHHIDGNRLNNQRANLLISSPQKESDREKPEKKRGIRNEYEVRGTATAIFLNRRDGTILETLIDTDDFEIIKEINGTWVAQWNPFTKTFYAVMSAGPAKFRNRLLLHRTIMQTAEDFVVDHINKDTLDNRKTNLRNVSSWANSQNSRTTNKHGERGVRWNEREQSYHVVVNYQGKQHFIGSYKDKELACIVSKSIRKLIERIEMVS